MSKEILLRYKGNKCSVCGVSVEEMLERFGTFKRMTEFHHIDPSKKSPNYSNLIRRKICTEQLDELDKCILLCSSCHAIVHAQNINVCIKLTLTQDYKQYSQTLKGQLVIDFKSKKAIFITDERFKLRSYIVRIGNSNIKKMVGIEIESPGFIRGILENISHASPVTIWDEKMENALFHLKALEDGDLHLQHSLRFPFLNFESSDNLPKLWVRNGMYLDESGVMHGNGTLDMVASIEYFT